MRDFLHQLRDVYRYLKTTKAGCVGILVFWWAVVAIPIVSLLSHSFVDALYKAMWSAGIVLVFAMARRYFPLMAHAHPVSNSIDFDDDGMVRVNLTPGVKRYSKPRHVIWFVERTIRLIGVAIVARIVLVIAQHNSSSFAKSQVILWSPWLWLVVTVYVQSGVYWYWRHGWRIQAHVGSPFVVLLRPGNMLFMIRGKGVAMIPIQDIMIDGGGSNRTRFEEVFAKRSSTLTLDSSMQADTAFHNMRRVLDAEELVGIIRWNQGASQRDKQASLDLLRSIDTKLGALLDFVRAAALPQHRGSEQAE